MKAQPTTMAIRAATGTYGMGGPGELDEASSLARARAAAAEQLAALPAQTIAKLNRVVLQFGASRKGRRAVEAILRQAKSAARVAERRARLHEAVKEARAFAQHVRLFDRQVAGLGPVKGMSAARVAELETLSSRYVVAPGWKHVADTHA